MWLATKFWYVYNRELCVVFLVHFAWCGANWLRKFFVSSLLTDSQDCPCSLLSCRMTEERRSSRPIATPNTQAGGHRIPYVLLRVSHALMLSENRHIAPHNDVAYAFVSPSLPPCISFFFVPFFFFVLPSCLIHSSLPLGFFLSFVLSFSFSLFLPAFPLLLTPILPSIISSIFKRVRKVTKRDYLHSQVCIFCPSVRPFARNNSAPSGQIFLTFYVGDFY